LKDILSGWMSRDDLMRKGFDWFYKKTHYKFVLIKDSYEMHELITFLNRVKQ